MYKDKDGIEYLTYKEIASQYGIANSTVGNWVREMEVDAINIPKRKGQMGQAVKGVKTTDAVSMMELRGLKPVVKNGATINDLTERNLEEARVKEPPEKKEKEAKPRRKERAHMARHNVKAPFCPFCGARKVANVTTQSLRVCLKCGGIYTVQRFKEGPSDGE